MLYICHFNMPPLPPQACKLSPCPSGSQHESLVFIRKPRFYMPSFNQARFAVKHICRANLNNGYKFLNQYLKCSNTKAFTTVPAPHRIISMPSLVCMGKVFQNFLSFRKRQVCQKVIHPVVKGRDFLFKTCDKTNMIIIYMKSS